MKKYILSILCIFSFAQSMELMQKENHEWDAQAFAKKNQSQNYALKYLTESKIDIVNKKILDIGCGIGDISSMLAATAKRVHGIDASKNMIEYAQQHYGNKENLTFEHFFAEDFITNKKYDCTISFFCLHWIKNKQKVFENINKSLKINGEFLVNLYISSDPGSLSPVVLKELLSKWQPCCNFLQNITVTESSLSRYVISNEECKEIIENSGFEIITYEKKSSHRAFENREKFAIFQRPVAMSRPLFKELSEENREWLFNEYIDLFLTKLEQNENKYYIFNSPVTTLIHARKVAELH